MALTTLLCALLLYQTQGSSAVTPVFVQTGGDVNLDVPEDQVPEKFQLFVWRFKTDKVLITFSSGQKKISEGYTDRIDTFENKYSVRLKNLKKADSGIYIGRVTANDEQILAEYNVTVQDPVLPVFLTSSVLNSSSCDLTVTCRADDSHISSSFRCDTKTCYQEGGERSEVTKSGASLHIRLSDESIICNHSNRVSWTKNETNIRSFCPRIHETRTHYLAVVIIVIIVFVILISVSILYYKRKRGRTGRTEISGNSVYAVPENIENIQTQNPYGADDPEDCSPSTTYSLVGPSARRDVPAESVYALIEK